MPALAVQTGVPRRTGGPALAGQAGLPLPVRRAFVAKAADFSLRCTEAYVENKIPEPSKKNKIDAEVN
ncbi:MAG: hypothetical protein K9J27_04385 [Bacteroidales bacterium]|nr:hypothetical protein [Bacteroidales bacterium]